MASLFPNNASVRRLIYEGLHRWSRFHGYSTFNIGYAPVDADILADPDFAHEGHQIQLYAELARTAGLSAAAAAGCRLLEVGVGGGGGLHYLKSRLNPAHVAGVDNAASGVKATRRKGIEAYVASADALPFPANEFDCVVCVDAMSLFPRAAFAREAARVLRPGGSLLIADYLVAPLAEIRQLTDEVADAGGFRVEQVRDASAGVLRALDLDHDRKSGIVARLPSPIRSRLTETMALKGSRRYQSWQDGKSCYYMAVLRCL